MLALVALSATPAFAAEKSPLPPNSDGNVDSGVKAERVDVETLKRKYWAKGDQYEMQVVQNRLYSKARRLELGLMGGFVSADPFLSIKHGGASLGFHFTEYLGFQALYWKFFVSESTASTDFKKVQVGVAPDSNEPRSFYGGEGVYSPIYGKLSVMGSAIIYYDFQVMLGGGVTQSESGNYPTFHFGVGQQVYLTRSLALKLAYRFMSFNETLLRKAAGSVGQRSITRQNSSSVLSIGLSFFI